MKQHPWRGSLPRLPRFLFVWADIYRAVETPGLVPLPRSAPNPACPVGRNIAPALIAVGDAAETAFLASLEAVTLKQFVKEIAAVDAAARGAA